MSTPSMSSAVNDDRLLTLARALVRIPSPSGPAGEAHVASFLGNYLATAGLHVEQDVVAPGRPNVIATLSGCEPGPRLILNGHTDVVPPGDEARWELPPYAGAVQGDRLYGRGAVDMKGPLAALIESVLAVRDAGLAFRGEIVLTLVVGEEDGQIGTRHLVERRGLRGDWAVVAEPTSLRPVICHKGLMVVDVTTFGRSCHASRAQDGVNAVLHMGRVLERLERLDAELHLRTHPRLGGATLTPTMIEGGTFSNVVPDRCTLTLDRRLLPGEDPARVLDEIRAALAEGAAEDGEFRFEVESSDIELPMEIRADDPVVTAVRGAVARLNGEDPGVHAWSATCDANLLVHSGTPAVIFGPGSIEQAHQPNEFVPIEQLSRAARIYMTTIERLLGAEGREIGA